jgi:hypothetical protein
MRVKLMYVNEALMSEPAVNRRNCVAEPEPEGAASFWWSRTWSCNMMRLNVMFKMGSLKMDQTECFFCLICLYLQNFDYTESEEKKCQTLC